VTYVQLIPVDFEDLGNSGDEDVVSTFAEADRVYVANLALAPVVHKNTIICHVISEEIIPAGQINMVRNLEPKMRGKEYSEKVLFMPRVNNESRADFIARLNNMKRDMAENMKKLYGEDYNIEFNVACPGKEMVKKIQEQEGMRALGFDTKNGMETMSVIQIEGIILALRALGSGKASSLVNAYKLLTGMDPEKKYSDVDELARDLLFTLPAAEVKGNELKRVNDLMEKNILNAA
jgi:hypothetical protein